MIAEVQSVLSQIAGREGVQEHSDLFAATGPLDCAPKSLSDAKVALL